MDSSRKKADSAFKYALYFELLAQKIDEYNIQKENIYNMDEKGFLIGILSKAKRIFSKQQFEKDGIQQRLQDGNPRYKIPGFKTSIQLNNIQALVHPAVPGNDGSRNLVLYHTSPPAWVTGLDSVLKKEVES
ncbi:hypothetical protein EYZ11_008032 [Aspergillus tanneri]|uniref:DDE-1 domain-containing protein n=1 Tax=Aspergillus tanneri TaxID=1220188 RepID=A0A4V3UNT8_9EURO|nr:hypothetical protein EYZ11_008032 [Aspergillus tanneri]